MPKTNISISQVSGGDIRVVFRDDAGTTAAIDLSPEDAERIGGKMVALANGSPARPTLIVPGRHVT